MKNRSYTQGGELSGQGGTEYIGFFSVLDGVPYEGKNQFQTKLSQSDQFFIQLKLSDYFFDQIIDETISLPHDLTECEIPIGEFQIENQINYRIQNLLDNLFFIGSKAQILNAVESQSTIGYLEYISGDDYMSTEGLSGYRIENYMGVEFLSTFNLSQISKITAEMRDQSICDQSILENGNLAVFFVGNTNGENQYINFLKVSLSQTPKIISLRMFDRYAMDDTSPTFKDVSQIRFVGDRLYIADAGRRTVLAYDVSKLVSSEFALDSLNTETLVKIIGGEGTTDDRNSFERPQSIVQNGDLISIYDSSLKVIRNYDRNLNWKQTYRKNTTLSSVDFITYSEIYGEYYALDNEGTFIRMNENLENIESKPFFVVPLSGETFLNIEMSDNLENIMYIVSNKRVIMKHVSNNSQSLGYVQYLSSFNQDINFASSAKNGLTNEDYIITTKYMGPLSQIGLSTDLGDYTQISLSKISPSYTSLFRRQNFRIYDYDNLSIKNDYHQAQTFLSLKKLMYNTLFMQSILTRKVQFSTIDQDKIITGIQYLAPNEQVNIDTNIIGIGINEHVSPETINRYIRNIYEIQEQMIKALNTKAQDSYEQGVPVLDDYLILSS